MCYIALVKNHTDNGGAIKQAFTEKLKWNDDGAFVSTLGGNALRTLDNKSASQAVLDMPINNMLVHFRQATTGAVTLGNVHGWEFNGWICVHNGFVSKLAGGKKQADSDSLKFFRLLTRKLQGGRNVTQYKRAIRKVCFEQEFLGRAMLYNPKLDILLMFGDWDLYEYGGAVVFSSTGLYKLGEKIIKEQNGLVFEYSEGVAVGESSLDGIFIMDNAKADNWTLNKIGELREPKPIKPTKTWYFPDNKPVIKYNEPNFTPLRPVIVPDKTPESIIPNGEIVGFDLGGNAIMLIDGELHTRTGSCCNTGSCGDLWDYLDGRTAEGLILSGIVYKPSKNPEYIGV